MSVRFCTIGHSNRSVPEFIDILRQARVGTVIDVRSFPRSRSNPGFDTELLPHRLGCGQIGYRHLPPLGGRRPRQPGTDDAVNAGWNNRSFHNYADYALSTEFTDALDVVLELGRQRKSALMCAEAVWWRCHRRIIADYLLLHGHAVDHLMAGGRAEPATPTPGAVLREDGKIIYPGEEAGR